MRYIPKRYFIIYSVNGRSSNHSGRYVGSTPMQAASKVFTYCIQHRLVTNSTKSIIAIRECSRGSRKKIFSYECERIRLHSPSVRHIRDAYGDNRTIQNNYMNRIKKYKKKPSKVESNKNINVDIVVQSTSSSQSCAVIQSQISNALIIDPNISSFTIDI